MNPFDLYHGGETPVKVPQVVSPKAVRPLFEDGIITKPEAIARLKTYKLVDQVLFHTETALKFLRFVDSEAIA